MVVLIDPPGWPAHGRLWSHLASDTSLEELHAFARRTGLPERGFEGDHYDVPQERYAALVAAGAVPVTGRDLVRRLQRSGLRRPKRRGERVLASFAQTPHSRVDTMLSALPPPGPVRVVQLLAVAGTHLLVLPDGATGTEGCLVPTAPVAQGEDPVGVLADLGGEVLGAAWRYGGPAVQVGYLRHVERVRDRRGGRRAGAALALAGPGRPSRAHAPRRVGGRRPGRCAAPGDGRPARPALALSADAAA